MGLFKVLKGAGKAAAVTTSVAWHAVAPGAGPAVQSHVEPPPTKAEYSRRVEQDQDKQYSDWHDIQEKQAQERGMTTEGRQVRDTGPSQSKSSRTGQTTKPQSHETKKGRPASREAKGKSGRPSR